MPTHAFGVRSAILKKNPRSNNREQFSNGETKVEIKAWEVWNSRYRRGTMPQSKVYGEETVCVVRTHDRFAGELQADDSLTFNGYTYSVQSAHPVETPLGVNKKDWEISLQ